MYIHIILIIEKYNTPLSFSFRLPPPWSPISNVQTRMRSRSLSGDDLASGSLVSKAQLIGAAPYPGAGALKRWMFWADTAWELKCQLAHLYAVHYAVYTIQCNHTQKAFYWRGKLGSKRSIP